MSVSLEILAALKPHFPSSRQVLSQRAPISEERWKQVAAQTGDPEVRWVLDNLSRSITRDDIIGLGGPNPATRRRRVVIASLMWGYGIAGSRWGSWVTDVSNFLSPGLDAALTTCEAHLSADRVAEAYKVFTCPDPGGIEAESHRGIGFPFITKILYFLARNSFSDVPAEYPLILDTAVSMALAQLTGYRLLARPTGYRPRPDSTAYVHYVKAMHAWAFRLEVLPEVIEYYLWNEASKSGSLLWEACLALHGQNLP